MFFQKPKRSSAGDEKREHIRKNRKMGLKLGRDCKISGMPDFGSEPYMITIGNHVGISRDVRFIAHDGGMFVVRALREDLRDVDVVGRIVVEDNVFIGAGTTIMPGVRIGTNSVIGSGAVVTHDIPPNSVAVGVPARVIETIDEYIEKNCGRYLHTAGMSAGEKRKYLESLDL